ncbi:MAG: glutaredoxin 3 [Candidatus Omnitrophica bacterium]|nr:glutaredoxin 3 [Candidatus Omnitrophota bacterium]
MPKPVTIYTTSYCPFCTRAKNLLKQKNISFKEVDITEDNKTREAIEKKTGWMTVPMIFIGEEFVGGSDELYALNASGELDKKLASS